MAHPSIEYLEGLVPSGGPEPAEFERLTRCFQSLAAEGVSGSEVRGALAPTLTTGSLQGCAYLKPHGYPGDFEMLDRIYTHWRSPDPRLARWDDYFQSQAAPRAVRNRKVYFQELLRGLDESAIARPAVLVVGAGPGRDLAEYFANRESRVSVVAIDLDPNAIEHAAGLCAPYGEHVTLEARNPRRFRPERRFDLIWCAGLFDYFEDELFVSTLERYVPLLNPRGELVVGNFANGNPTRAYMELVGDWFLQYRTAEQLAELAAEAGVSNAQVHSEPEGVNLFLHVPA